MINEATDAPGMDDEAYVIEDNVPLPALPAKCSESVRAHTALASLEPGQSVVLPTRYATWNHISTACPPSRGRFATRKVDGQSTRVWRLR